MIDPNDVPTRPIALPPRGWLARHAPDLFLALKLLAIVAGAGAFVAIGRCGA